MSVPRDGKFQWALMKSGEVEIMFQSRSSLTKELDDFQGVTIGGSLTLYISITAIKEFYNFIKEKVQIGKELHTTSYGMTEFTMQDCNGYIIVFAERL